ncbi:MAG: zinc-binding dehydrogenase [Chloroflexi bacterium]|nr:zinc-binding dehydrogenase [Chloroflexota bacterium]
MRGILFPGDRRVVVREFPDPVPGPRQVVVRMRVAAVCGSDLHGYRARAAERGAQAEIIPGHEPCGDVVAVGSEVHSVKVGDRVTVYHYLGCGHCRYCLAGFIQWCPERKGYGGAIHGSDADLLLTNEINCLPLPPGLSYIDGAFIACQASTAYSSLLKLEPSGRDTIAIFGLGPVGLCGVMMARAMGARVVGIDVVPERLELARRFGAEEVIPGDRADVVARLRDLTGGEGPRLAFETSGNALAHQNVIDALAKGGKGVFVGFGAHEKTVNLTAIIGKQLILMGSFVAPIYLYWDLVDFLLRHRLPLADLVTHRFALEEAEEALRLADTARTGKVIFEWP